MKLHWIGCALVFLLFASPSLAQYSIGWIGSTTWIGLRAGTSIAGETFDSLPDNSSNSLRAGFLGGLTAEHWFNNNLAFGASVLYDQKGTSELYADAAQNRQAKSGKIYSGTDNFSISYLEIPVVLKYALGDGLVRPYLCAGPSFGVLLSASETSSGDLAPLSEVKPDLKTTDISFYIALGAMDHILHGPILFFEAGYALGLTSIFQSAPMRSATDGTLFPAPINPTLAKSGDIRVSIGSMWEL